MSDTDKRFQTFFDIRHDDKFVHQRVRRLGSNNGRLGQADKTAVFVTLLGMADSRAFHRRFHSTRSAAGTDIQLAQPQLVTDFTSVQVFGFIDGVTAPADDHIRIFINMQSAGVTQNKENQVGNMCAVVQIQAAAALGIGDLGLDEQNIAQHGKQVSLE